jgi:hypothetical protein
VAIFAYKLYTLFLSKEWCKDSDASIARDAAGLTASAVAVGTAPAGTRRATYSALVILVLETVYVIKEWYGSIHTNCNPA